MIAFVLIVVGLMLTFDAAWWWHADRRLRPLRRARLWRGLLAAFVVTQAAVLLWAFASRRSGDVPTPLFALTFLWHLIVLPFSLVAILLGSGASAAAWGAGRLVGKRRTVANDVAAMGAGDVDDDHAARTAGSGTSATGGVATAAATATGESGWSARVPTGASTRAGGASTGPAAVSPGVAAPAADSPELPSRRAVLRAAAVAGLPPLLAGVGTARALAQLDAFRVRPLDVSLPGLPAALDGMTIAHVSDTHVGEFTNGRTLLRIAEATNALRADLVLFTGDLLNRRLSDLPAALDMLKRMDPRHGLFLCEGNHDLFEGRGPFAGGVAAAGVSLLSNDAATVTVRGHAVQVLGLRWGHGQNRREGGDAGIAATLPDLLARRRPDAFPILLAHHPHAFDHAAAAGIPLTLAGHTHGGQLHLTREIGFGRMYRYWSGLYAQGRSRLAVSNGVGNWFPLRINAPAEILHLTLRRA